MFISSTGGHLDELLQLKPLFSKYDSYIITEKDKSNESLKEIYGEKLYFLPYGTRAKLFTYIFKYFYLCLRTVYLYLRIRPKVDNNYRYTYCRTNVYIGKAVWKQK